MASEVAMTAPSSLVRVHCRRALLREGARLLGEPPSEFRVPRQAHRGKALYIPVSVPKEGDSESNPKRETGSDRAAGGRKPFLPEGEQHSPAEVGV